MNAQTEAVLYLAIMLSVTTIVLMVFAYLMFRRETSSDRIVNKLDAALSSQAIANQARPWHASGPDYRPEHATAYEVRPAWYKGHAFLAWWNGSHWVDFYTREQLLAQDWEWRKLIRISTQA